MHFKKVVFALTAITAVIVLAGCEEEASKNNPRGEHQLNREDCSRKPEKRY